MESFFKRINNGYDGVIRKIICHSEEEIEIIISTMDTNNDWEWINVIFTIRNIKEFKIHKKFNYSNNILSNGIKYIEIDDFNYIDFAPYSDQIDTIEEIYNSDIFFCGNITWEVLPYNEFP